MLNTEFETLYKSIALLKFPEQGGHIGLLGAGMVPANNLWSLISGRWLVQGTPQGGIGLFYLTNDAEPLPGRATAEYPQLHNWYNELKVNLYLQQQFINNRSRQEKSGSISSQASRELPAGQQGQAKETQAPAKGKEPAATEAQTAAAEVPPTTERPATIIKRFKAAQTQPQTRLEEKRPETVKTGTIKPPEFADITMAAFTQTGVPGVNTGKRYDRGSTPVMQDAVKTPVSPGMIPGEELRYYDSLSYLPVYDTDSTVRTESSQKIGFFERVRHIKSGSINPQTFLLSQRREIEKAAGVSMQPGTQLFWYENAQAGFNTEGFTASGILSKLYEITPAFKQRALQQYRRELMKPAFTKQRAQSGEQVTSDREQRTGYTEQGPEYREQSKENTVQGTISRAQRSINRAQSKITPTTGYPPETISIYTDAETAITRREGTIKQAKHKDMKTKSGMIPLISDINQTFTEETGLAAGFNNTMAPAADMTLLLPGLTGVNTSDTRIIRGLPQLIWTQINNVEEAASKTTGKPERSGGTIIKGLPQKHTKTGQTIPGSTRTVSTPAVPAPVLQKTQTRPSEAASGKREETKLDPVRQGPISFIKQLLRGERPAKPGQNVIKTGDIQTVAKTIDRPETADTTSAVFRGAEQFFRQDTTQPEQGSILKEVSYKDRWHKTPQETRIITTTTESTPDIITHGSLIHNIPSAQPSGIQQPGIQQPDIQQSVAGSNYPEQDTTPLHYVVGDPAITGINVPARIIKNITVGSGVPATNAGITPIILRYAIGQQAENPESTPAGTMSNMIFPANIKPGETNNTQNTQLNYLHPGTPRSGETKTAARTPANTQTNRGRQNKQTTITGKPTQMLSVPNMNARTDPTGSLYYHDRTGQPMITDTGTTLNTTRPTQQPQQQKTSKPIEHRTTTIKPIDMTVTKPPGMTPYETAMDPVQMNRLVNQVYEQLERKMFHERRRMGL